VMPGATEVLFEFTLYSHVFFQRAYTI